MNKPLINKGIMVFESILHKCALVHNILLKNKIKIGKNNSDENIG